MGTILGVDNFDFTIITLIMTLCASLLSRGSNFVKYYIIPNDAYSNF